MNVAPDLDRALDRLLEECGADAAVVWSRYPRAGAGTVLRSRPDGTLAAGTPWPVTGTAEDGAEAREPAELAALVPVVLDLELPAAPATARSFPLAGADLVLLVVWCAPVAGELLTEQLTTLIRTEIAPSAQTLDQRSRTERDARRLQAAVDSLEQGVVTVDVTLGQAHANPAAARLLGLDDGDNRSADFAAALMKLEQSALDRGAGAPLAEALLADPGGEVERRWRLPTPPSHLRVTSAAVHRNGFAGRVWVFTDVSSLAAALEDAEQVRDLLQAGADAMLDPQALLIAERDASGRVVDLRYQDVNRATCEHLGMDRADLIGRSLLDATPGVGRDGLLDHYRRCLEHGEPVILDDHPHFNAQLGEERRYDIRATRSGPDLLTLGWRDVTERFRALRRTAESEQRFRRTMDYAAIGMCLANTAGEFVEVNEAICRFFGYDAPTLRRMTWQELTAPEYLEKDLDYVDEVVAGRIDSYRMTKQFLHADGGRVWGDLAVSCLRDPAGQVQIFIAQIVDITEMVAAQRAVAQRDAENRLLTAQLRDKTERLSAQIASAASYVASILPGDLTGEVVIASRYLPSLEVGGDSFDFTWFDDDHLLVHLIDVSGHGVEPALLSISLHNLLRSGSLPAAILLAPELLLSELNRLFQMDQQGHHYFTMWYGVYQPSRRTLRYASAGHPPALAFHRAGPAAVEVTELETAAVPVGMFAESPYRAATFAVPPGARLLIYSDGVSDIPSAAITSDTFLERARRVAARPDWTLDDLVADILSTTPDGRFDDDCALILMSID